jgi:hypothetical protein
MTKKTTTLYLFLQILSFNIFAQNEKTPLLKSLLKENYDVFVQKLGENIHDEKFLEAIKAGDKNIDKIDFDIDVVYTAKDLIPTQNEIDVDKSLLYPLSKEKAETLKRYLLATPNDVFSPGGVIITAGGKYIIDGHHRWSQLYMINPDAKIKAINIKIDNPELALKITQLAIGAIAKKIPSSLVQGKNLLKMNQEELSTWIKQNVSNNAIQAFKDLLPVSEACDTKCAIANYIWKNVESMQTSNRPIQGAPHRGIMPQTDQAQGWIDLLRGGLLDVR